MSHVKILPPDVIAKIAAGEAVDRPASVVKELLENALDAKASRIEIHLKDGGKELIHIKDNGSGINLDDLKNLFQRHATSKIAGIDDLETLHSMGFRGEALYSIAAVSAITLSTRTADPQGWQIHLEGGIRQNLEPIALAQQGTDIKIAKLFFNTPARRKFLKTTASELNQILQITMPYALIYPEKSFLLTHAGRTILDLKSAKDMRTRIAEALNLDEAHLLECTEEFNEEKIRIHLFLGDINIQRPRRDQQFIFINDRPVESKNLSFNANDVYKLILPPGVYGSFVLQIHIDPAMVDVNIHPTKREVRLSNEGLLIRILRRMIENKLMTQGNARQINPPNPSYFTQDFSIDAVSQDAYQKQPLSQFFNLPLADHYKKDAQLPVEFELFGRDNSLKSKFTHARYIGSFLRKFLLFETNESLLVVDQHAAQERIMFEKFKNALELSAVESQPLLTPILIKLSPAEKIIWEELHEKLHVAGIDTTQFDDDTIAIQTQPLLLKNIEAVVRALLAGDDAPRMDHNALARRACKASVVAGDKLDPLEVDHQRQELLNCQNPFTCPHGRPTVIEVTHQFLDRQFLRE